MRQTKSINRNILSYFVLPIRHEENNCKTGAKIKSEFICHMMNIALSVHQLDNNIKSKTVKDDMALLVSYGWWLSQAPLGLKLKPIVTGEYTNDGKITIDDKNRYSEVLEQKRQDLRREIDKLEQNQGLNEATIDYVCNFMIKPAKLWKDADLETKQAFQKMLFPKGLHFDIKNKIFGTDDLSPLFSVIDNKKESCDGSNSELVISARVELALTG